MAQSTVAQFAAELRLPTALLLEQLKSAGVNKAAAEDKLDEADKTALLDFLRKEHGAAATPKSKITLVRKQNTEIKKTDSTGRARTIQVEVRKKRVLERRDEVDETIKAQPEIEEVITHVLEESLAVEEEIVTPVVPEIQPLISEAPKSTTLKKQVLTPEQVAIREQEAKRHATLLALQEEDFRKKQELVQRREIGRASCRERV